MPDTTNSTSPTAEEDIAVSDTKEPLILPEQLALKRRYPTAQDLRERARRRMPNFAFEYVDGGAGAPNGLKLSAIY